MHICTHTAREAEVESQFEEGAGNGHVHGYGAHPERSQYGPSSDEEEGEDEENEEVKK